MDILFVIVTALIAWNGYIKAHDYIREVPKHFISALIKTMKIE